MKVHVVYYSLTGNTARVCQAVADTLGAGISRIEAQEIGHGFWSMMRWGFLTLRGKRIEVSGPQTELAGVDLVVLGGQVWAGRLSVPMRSWLLRKPALPARVALVLTSGDPKRPQRAFDRFAALAGRPVAATLHVSEADAKSGRFDDKVAAFCAELRG